MFRTASTSERRPIPLETIDSLFLAFLVSIFPQHWDIINLTRKHSRECYLTSEWRTRWWSRCRSKKLAPLQDKSVWESCGTRSSRVPFLGVGFPSLYHKSKCHPIRSGRPSSSNSLVSHHCRYRVQINNDRSKNVGML